MQGGLVDMCPETRRLGRTPRRSLPEANLISILRITVGNGCKKSTLNLSVETTSILYIYFELHFLYPGCIVADN